MRKTVDNANDFKHKKLYLIKCSFRDRDIQIVKNILQTTMYEKSKKLSCKS